MIDALHGKGAGGFAQFLRAYAGTLDRPEDVPLSPAEISVLRGLDAGRRPKALAEMSGKSVETIRSQIKSAIRKLGVSGQTEAVAAARRRGLLS
ncbi:MAG: response regulator transcription factor [Candidatus Eremiobacteraeota bacterium]|nr:response regulator transcription factor [Candidatus Eremiobacteraeota bacterium]